MPTAVSLDQGQLHNLHELPARPSNTFELRNAVSSPRYSRLGDSGDQEHRSNSISNQWSADMSVDLSERPKRSHQKNRQVMPISPSSHETTPIASGGNSAVDCLNPWKIAKINGSNQIPLPKSDTALKYTPVSPLTPEPPVLRHIMAPPGDLNVPRSHKEAGRAALLYPLRTTVPGGPYRSPVSSPLESRVRGVSAIAPNHPQTNASRRREQLPWIPPSSLEGNRHNTSDIDSTRSRRIDSFKQTQISFRGGRAGRRQHRVQEDIPQPQVRSTISPNEPEGDSHLDIQDIFSRAKKNLGYQLSRMEDSDLTKGAHNSEHQRRQQQSSRPRQPFAVLQTNSFANRETSQADREPIATTLPIGDPRAYLLRRQKSMAAEESDAKPRKLRRVKSSLMPLENILSEYGIHSLSCTVRVDSSVLNELIQWVKKYDEYVIYGTLLDGLDMSLADGQVVESQLQKLLTEQKENVIDGGTEKGQGIIDLQATLKGKSVLHAPAT
ncbi:hypothetical protein F4803DRAFT_499268 [Xylaria telfairii]|nr:hypothetical protein F4803DRAFT_499268 [Xylaria telfairii]